MFLIIVGFQIRAMERVDREEVPSFEPDIPTDLYLKLLLNCRAAERYADITPQERERRRERGWDLPQGAVSLRAFIILCACSYNI